MGSGDGKIFSAVNRPAQAIGFTLAGQSPRFCYIRTKTVTKEASERQKMNFTDPENDVSILTKITDE